MPASKDHYAILGVTPDASDDEVQQAYRDLLKVWHPDRFNRESDRLKKRAEEHCKQLNEAYAAIRNSPRGDGGTDFAETRQSASPQPPQTDSQPQQSPNFAFRPKAPGRTPYTYRQIFVGTSIVLFIVFVVFGSIHTAGEAFAMVFASLWVGLCVVLVVRRFRQSR